MYTVKPGDYVLVLHCFKKKATEGVKMPRKGIDLIRERFKDAKAIFERMKAEKRNAKD